MDEICKGCSEAMTCISGCNKKEAMNNLYRECDNTTCGFNDLGHCFSKMRDECKYMEKKTAKYVVFEKVITWRYKCSNCGHTGIMFPSGFERMKPHFCTGCGFDITGYEILDDCKEVER